MWRGRIEFREDFRKMKNGGIPFRSLAGEAFLELNASRSIVNPTTSTALSTLIADPPIKPPVTAAASARAESGGGGCCESQPGRAVLRGDI
jgi:hypothetical protein